MTKKVLISLDELEELAEYLGDAEDWFNAQPPAPQWVRVEEGLPEHGERVFVRNGDIILSLLFNKELNVFMSRASSALHHAVETATHWMPIPPLPEGEE